LLPATILSASGRSVLSSQQAFDREPKSPKLLPYIRTVPNCPRDSSTSSSRIRPNVADATALLLAAGVADTVAMRTVGHADARILARYQDVVTELQRDAAARMDSLLGARPRDCDQKCDPPEDRRAAKLPLTWSGRRDSNPRPPPWQGGALPLSHVRVDLRV
jgi:hypothetical protein